MRVHFGCHRDQGALVCLVEARDANCVISGRRKTPLNLTASTNYYQLLLKPSTGKLLIELSMHAVSTPSHNLQSCFCPHHFPYTVLFGIITDPYVANPVFTSKSSSYLVSHRIWSNRPLLTFLRDCLK